MEYAFFDVGIVVENAGKQTYTNHGFAKAMVLKNRSPYG
jgi:hypothetical protein